MLYPITKTVGWIFCVFAIYLLPINYSSPFVYIVICYSTCWLFLTKLLTLGIKYIKVLLLCLQAIAILSIGYHLVQGTWLFIYVYYDNNFGEGSPAAYLFGLIVRLILWNMIFTSFLEIVLLHHKKVQVNTEPLLLDNNKKVGDNKK